MTTEYSVPTKNSLAVRLLRIVFSLYVLGALAVTAGQMTAEYLVVKKNISREMARYERVFSDGLAMALLDRDQKKADSMVEVMVGVPDIVGVKITDRQTGAIFARAGTIIEKKDREKTGDENDDISNLFWNTFPIISTHGPGRTELGTMTIYSSAGVVFQKLWLWFFFLTVGAVLKSVLLWIIFLWFSRKMVARPLTALAEAARGLSLSNLDDYRIDLKTDQRDEFMVIQEAFNQMIESLKKSRHELSDRKQVEEALEKAKLEAETADLVKSEFLARMSHEIRTPLNAIIGLTELTMKTGLSVQQKDYLTKIKRSSDSLLTIINDILDFSTIESEGLELDTVDIHLENMIREISRHHGVAAAEKGLELFFFLDPEIPEVLTGDAVRIKQILMNLVGNAIKFTVQGEVVVRAMLEKIDGDRVDLRFSVTDTGIGIAPEKIPVLFEPFTQADGSSTRKFGGSGLGLSAVKRILEKMDRDISVVSRPGKGSTFSFELGFGYKDSGRRSHWKVPEKLKGKKILVLEDNQTSRTLFTEILSFFSFEVQVEESLARTLEELENAAEKDPFELVILNWIMPGLDGMEATRRIRENHKFRNLPVIVLSKAATRPNRIDRTEMMDKIGFLRKPVTPSSVLEAIIESFGGDPAVELGRKREAEPANGDDPGKIRGARILVVEDNPVNLQVAVEILTREGLSVDVALDGRQAIEKVINKKYDCLLMDVEMPGMDGHEATRLIRKKLGLTNLPIIAMTAHTLKGDKEKCLEAGMNDYLPKPVGTKQMFSALVKWIKPGPGLGTKIRPAKVPLEEDLGLFESLPGFDLKKALERIEGHTDIYRKVLREFYQEFASAGRTIRECLDRGDTDTCHRLAHNLKGGAGNIGAVDLYGTASDLVLFFRQGQVQNMENLLDKLDGQLDNVLNLISRLDRG